MSTAIPSAKAPTPVSLQSLIVAILGKLAVVWLIGMGVTLIAIGLLAPQLLLGSLVIALASGLISLAALWPGRRLSRSRHPLGDAGALPTVIVLAMAIRVTGTVALLLFCRYQMGQSFPDAALLVGVWYVVLTSFEVSLLARGARMLSITGDPVER